MDGSGERRRNDRRINDRRGGGRRRDDALFQRSEHIASEPFFDPGWLAAGDMPADSRELLQRVRRLAAAQDSALARVFRTYTAARAVLGVGLVAAQGAFALSGSRVLESVTLICLAYAVLALTLWLLPRFAALGAPQPAVPRRRLQWWSTIGVDIAAFLMMHLLEAGANFNYAALLVLPVLMAGVLTARLFALGTAAAVSLALLLIAWRAAGSDTASAGLMLQSGLAGLGLFLIAVLAGELAARLAREEAAARGSLELARQQAQLNRLVIEEMVDGVLVVDRDLRVRAANPAARALLVDQGLAPPAPFTLADRGAWQGLRDEVARALAAGDWPEAGREVQLVFGGGHTRTLRLRVRFMRGQGLDPTAATEGAPAGDESLAVLLIEDQRTATARVRQEKLAAMGRVSAGIAHEIRNPLAAIAQANALLMEDDITPAQQRLAQIVADNVSRLKRLVDDVMEVAPGATPPARTIDLRAAIAALAGEWAAAHGVAPGGDSRLRLDLGGGGALPVPFDPEHLRRVLVNLLDNAHRHAPAVPPRPGAILLLLAERGESEVQLSVLSDGEPIAPDVEPHLFEPFFSTRSRGSGLGLYICRELCERYGASIEYRPHPAAERLRNEFVVTMRRAATEPAPA
jgi:two-component system sensor histidine kinase PilS (NtrC family)